MSEQTNTRTHTKFHFLVESYKSLSEKSTTQGGVTAVTSTSGGDFEARELQLADENGGLA